MQINKSFIIPNIFLFKTLTEYIIGKFQRKNSIGFFNIFKQSMEKLGFYAL